MDVALAETGAMVGAGAELRRAMSDMADNLGTALGSLMAFNVAMDQYDAAYARAHEAQEVGSTSQRHAVTAISNYITALG